MEATGDAIGLKKLLSFKGIEGDGLRKRIDEMRGLETIEDVDEMLSGFCRVESSNELFEKRKQFGALPFDQYLFFGSRGPGILQQLDLRRAIESAVPTWVFLQDAEAAKPEKQNLKSAVGLFLRLRDLAQTTDLEDRRIPRHIGESFRTNGDHPDLVRAFERGPNHLDIAWLEESQRYGDFREQYDIGQGKKR